MDERRPDPLVALRAAAQECGMDVPDGLLQQVLALEEQATEQRFERAMAQARLRGLIEEQSKEAP